MHSTSIFAMNSIAEFLQPYLSAILGAAFSLQQALEGLSLHGSNFLVTDTNGRIINSYWSVKEAVALPLLFLLLYVCVLGSSGLVAVRVLAGWRGLFVGLFVLAMPGLLSIVGVFPNLRWLPESYNAGSGELGSPWGMFALLLVAMGTGWTSIVLLSKLFRFDDRFRHGYDQFWYAMAISAGLFFVIDMGAANDREKLRDSAATSKAASGYLLEQVRRLDAECEMGKVRAPVACKWAKTSQWELAQFADYNHTLYWQLGPENEDYIYAGKRRDIGPEDIQTLRQELHRYNLNKCPIKNLGSGVRQFAPVSSTCSITPASFCIAYPSNPLRGVDPGDGILSTVAISNECVVPGLVALKVEQEKLALEVASNSRARHLRWLLFLFTAFVAGGKVANASIRMFDAIGKERVNRRMNEPVGLPHDASDAAAEVTAVALPKKSRRWVLAPGSFKPSSRLGILIASNALTRRRLARRPANRRQVQLDRQGSDVPARLAVAEGDSD